MVSSGLGRRPTLAWSHLPTHATVRLSRTRCDPEHQKHVQKFMSDDMLEWAIRCALHVYLWVLTPTAAPSDHAFSHS
jgi:hypothetical protein